MSDGLFKRFGPFIKGCELPKCVIRIFETTEDAGFLFEGPAFSVFSDAVSNEGSQCVFRVNEYRFAPCGDGVAVWCDQPVWAWVHDGFSYIEVVVKRPFQLTEGFFAVIMRAYQYAALHGGALLMHSAAVAYGGEGLLFCGVPGAGKSTQAKLWRGHLGAEAINNDQPCIVYKAGRAFVSGSPWSGKEPCYKNLCVPARAIVFVEKSAENRIEKVSSAEAYGLLYLNEYVVPVRPETEREYDAAIRRLVSCVPVLRQYCTKTEEAPATLAAFLENELGA